MYPPLSIPYQAKADTYLHHDHFKWERLIYPLSESGGGGGWCGGSL